MIRELNIALIGCGNWGKNLARNLHQMGSLACIYDTNFKLSKIQPTSSGIADKMPICENLPFFSNIILLII